MDEFDFAIIILTPDDFLISRDIVQMSPRDNVIFELGLFIGKLGRERTVAIYDRTAGMKIPSDLAGITHVPFQPHSTGNLEAALGAPCTRLKKVIKALGRRHGLPANQQVTISTRVLLRGGGYPASY